MHTDLTTRPIRHAWRLLAPGCCVIIALTSARVLAQSVDPMPMPALAPMPAATPAASGHDEMLDMNMSGSMKMTAMYGGYGMSREASGTSWQPDTTPDAALELHWSDWMLMVRGYIDAVADQQGGPRGRGMLFSESMLMVMAERQLGPGTLGIHTMFSLDPLMGPSGYPLLFASGETANGSTPLIDRQHPHDLFMELATSYSVPLGKAGSVFGYAGLPGEPALGPPAFMHRFSGADIPEAPITHHWLDSTHITEGVVTAGLVIGPAKLEASSFNGREPDQFRYNIETRSFDSQSMRLSFNPTAEWSLQISQGFLKSPEQLEPDLSVERRTASAIYQTRLYGYDWGTTLAWGEDRRSNGVDTPALLLESTIKLNRYTAFARLEHLSDDELFLPDSPLANQPFKVSKLSLGGIDDFYQTHHMVFGVGALISRYQHDAALDSVYGSPTSGMLFVRAKIVP